MTEHAVGDPLTWNVATLLTEALGSTRDYRVAGVTIGLGEDLRLADPVEGDVRLTRTNRGLLVHAELGASLDMACSRCLRDIEVPVELRLDEEALPSLDITSGLPVDQTAEPDVLRLTAHHELELESIVREGIQLAEPIAPLCEPDCPGLCATCGERLAGPPHQHADEDVDPRLAGLRAFQVDGERESG